MKHAVIQNGKVINIVEAEPDVAAERGWVECEIGGIGWDYDGSTFIDNRPEPVVLVPAPAPTKEELMLQIQALSEQIQALT